MRDGVMLLRWGLAAILYTFLGLAFYVMWRGLQQSAQRDMPQHIPARLVAKLTGDAESSISLTPVSTVGRAINNRLQLEDEFTSAHHVMLMWRDNAWWIEDMNSHNGTYLNQELITQPTLLTFGDQIRIGDTTLRFEKDEAYRKAGVNGE